MTVFILILLLIAAIFGVLGTVLKVTAILVLSGILAVVIIGWLIWWAVRRQTRRYIQQVQDQQPGKTGQAYDAEGRVRKPELPE